jgi:hypothetical protein
MRFNPDKEDASLLLPPGEYDFEVLGAEERVSTTGNDMFVLKLRAGSNGNSRFVTDYVLAKNTKKLYGVAKTCGLVDRFLAGEILAADFVGKKGRAFFTIEKGSTQYPEDRNVVARYVKG